MPKVSPHSLTDVLVIVEALAIFAFAISGLLEAARKRLDAVGVCMVTGLTAFGGGTLRDVLLDRRPFFWVEHATWLWALLLLCIVAMFFLRTRHFEPTERAMQWPDAVGLGLFAATGLRGVEICSNFEYSCARNYIASKDCRSICTLLSNSGAKKSRW